MGFAQEGSHSNWVSMDQGIKLARLFWWCSGRLEVKIDIDKITEHLKVSFITVQCSSRFFEQLTQLFARGRASPFFE